MTIRMLWRLFLVRLDKLYFIYNDCIIFSEENVNFDNGVPAPEPLSDQEIIFFVE